MDTDKVVPIKKDEDKVTRSADIDKVVPIINNDIVMPIGRDDRPVSTDTSLLDIKNQPEQELPVYKGTPSVKLKGSYSNLVNPNAETKIPEHLKSKFTDVYDKYRSVGSSGARSVLFEHLDSMYNAGVPMEELKQEELKFRQIDKEIEQQQKEQQKKQGIFRTLGQGISQGLLTRPSDTNTRDDYTMNLGDYEMKNIYKNPAERKMFFQDLAYVTGRALADVPAIVALSAMTAPIAVTGPVGVGVSGAFVGAEYMGLNKAVDIATGREESQSPILDTSKAMLEGGKDFGLAMMGGEVASGIATKVLSSALPKIASKTGVRIASEVIPREVAQQYIFNTLDEQRLGRPLTDAESALSLLPNAVGPVSIKLGGSLRSKAFDIGTSMSSKAEYVKPIDYAKLKQESILTERDAITDKIAKSFPNVSEGKSYIEFINEKTDGSLFKTDEQKVNFTKSYEEAVQRNIDNRIDLSDPSKIKSTSKEAGFDGYKKNFKVKAKAEKLNEWRDVSPDEFGNVLRDVETLRNELSTIEKDINYRKGATYKRIKKYFKSDAEIANVALRNNEIDAMFDGKLDDVSLQDIKRVAFATDDMIANLAKEVNYNNQSKSFKDTVKESSITKPIKSAGNIIGFVANKAFKNIGSQNFNFEHNLGKNVDKFVTNSMDSLTKYTHGKAEEIRLLGKDWAKIPQQDKMDVQHYMALRAKHLNSKGETVLDAGGHYQRMIDDGTIPKDTIERFSKSEEAFNKMTPEQQMLVKGLDGIYQMFGRDINRSHFVAGDPKPMNIVEGYSPIVIDKLEYAIEKGYDITDPNITGFITGKPMNKKSKVDINSEFTKSRKGGKRTLELDPVKNMERYVNAMLHKTYGYPIYKKMVQLSNEIAKTSPANAKLLRDTVDYNFGQFHDDAPLAHAVGNMAKRNTASTLFGSLTTLASQPQAITAVVAKLGPIEVNNAIMSLLDNNKNTADQGVIIGRIMDDSVNDISNLKNKIYKGVVEAGIYPTKFVDYGVASIAHEAMYNKALRETGDVSEARYQASKFVSDTQASGSRMNIPVLSRYAYGKFFFPFMTFQLNNFHMIVGDMLGLQPTYTYVQSGFKTKAEAMEFANKKGYSVKKVNDGTYTAFDVRKLSDYAKGILQLSVLTALNGAYNTLTSTASAETGMDFGQAGPSPLDSRFKEKYGITFAELKAGKTPKGTTRTRAELERAGNIAGAREFASDFVPLAGPLLSNNPERFAQGTMGNFITGVRKIHQGIDSKRPEKIAEGVNDLSMPFGNILAKPIKQIVKYYSNKLDEEERYMAMMRKSGGYKPEPSAMYKFVHRRDEEKKLLRKMEKEASGGGGWSKSGWDKSGW